MLTDAQSRLSALNTQRSFLVQAPAGSGKTELLTQRFLKLLSVVKAPEEIIAITFTRKAAAEMRERILTALLLAHNGALPDEPHKQLTFKLADAALQRDRQLEWHLIDNPNRLRVLTIDALAGFLSAQIPILAGFGSNPEISDDVQSLYQIAARELVSSLTDDTPWKPAIETLLLHLDNQAQRVIDLLCAILAKREQWLPHILGYHHNTEQLHQHLKQGLQTIAEETISQFVTHCGDHLLEQMQNLTALAAENLTAENQGKAQPDQWQALCDLFLTQQDEWRKSVTKRQGFPAKSQEKARLLELLEMFSDDDSLLERMIQLRHCPPAHYAAMQQLMIDALIELLPILYAQLRLVFQQHNAIDFVELNLAALRALGEEDEPTDLALYLDYQIQHLLIDEFQDTSITQYTLLERLTRGWENGDGRSLFLVGDPMQSIYRFRDAEVGLFLRAEHYPINDIVLTKLTLQNNYRSDKAIIDWVNTTFNTIFPNEADISQGAVPYSESIAMRDYKCSGVHGYGIVDQPATAEANKVIATISQLQHDHPDESIAILVRSRNQLRHIIPLLHEHKLSFQAVDLETLYDRPEIQDLMTLTRALLHREDRIAWYALLRSPICGLLLADLHTIAQQATQHSIWHTLVHAENLSNDGHQRVLRIVAILEHYFAEQGRKPFELALKGVWQALGFEELLSLQQRDNTTRFFKLIADSNNHITIERLTEQLIKTYVQPQQASSKLSIMTIHKSKGLEFDHVLLPGLNSKAATNKHDLMLWLERPNQQGSIDLILAPIKAASKQHDAIYQYLQRTEKTKLEYEMARLLYVAVTRSKRSLHLFASLQSTSNDDVQFKPNSFASLLAPLLREQLYYDEQPITSHDEITTPLLQRVSSSWKPQQSLLASTPAPMANPLPKHDNQLQRHVGTVIHELLAYPQHRTVDYAKRRLQQAGLTRLQLPQALDIIQLTLVSIEHDPRAQWILDPSHREAYNEYAVTTLIKGKIRHLIIDRTFVDSDDTRWIIDYKTATPGSLSTADFLAEQQTLYHDQLTNYAQAMAGLDARPIKTALYFPVCKLWSGESLTVDYIRE